MNYTVAFITYLLLTAVVIGMILDSSISTYLSIIHLVATLDICSFLHETPPKEKPAGHRNRFI